MSAFSHKPVLVDEVCEALGPPFTTFGGRRSDGVLVDLTCGGAGHTAALLQQIQPRSAVLFDRDPAALEAARARLHEAPCEVIFVHAPFSSLDEELDRLGMPQGIVMRHRPGHFQHLFSTSGYAAGYYVYLWAEVLDATAEFIYGEDAPLFI